MRMDEAHYVCSACGRTFSGVQTCESFCHTWSLHDLLYATVPKARIDESDIRYTVRPYCPYCASFEVGPRGPKDE